MLRVPYRLRSREALSGPAQCRDSSEIRAVQPDSISCPIWRAPAPWGADFAVPRRGEQRGALDKGGDEEVEGCGGQVARSGRGEGGTDGPGPGDPPSCGCLP